MNPDLPSLLSWLREVTGRSFSPRSFANRLRIQKAIYLLNALGYSGVRQYSFNSYLHGPYSPTLAADYYAIGEPPEHPRRTFKAPSDRTRAALIEAVLEGNDFLEGAAALHWVAKRNPGASAADVKGVARGLKPHLADEIRRAWGFLKKRRLVGAST